MNNLDQIQTIDDYFAAFSSFHVRKATELLDPLHVPGRDPLADFSDMLREPFAAQSHVATAAIKMLDESRRGIIAAECGVGKTLIGILAIHKHAQRSVRKGGCNGNYRAIALVPGHLCGKWRDELEDTVPGVKVTLLDTGGKGCKQLIVQMSRLYQQMRGPNGRWKKPTGAEWYILGRDDAKLAPARSSLGIKRKGFSGNVGDPGSSRRILVEIEDKNGTKRRIEARKWVCPSCGKPIVDKNGAPVNLPKSARLMTCDGKFGREIPEPDRKECGLDRSQWRKELDQVPAGRIIEQKGKRWRVCECRESLWQFTAKPKRWPPAAFIAKKMPGAFRYLIVDELHEHKSDSSGQATACGKLISSTRYCLGMTGTLIGGYADHLFPLLFRMSADRLRAKGFEWAKGLAFTERYGRIERIVTTKESAGELALTTSNRSMRRERSGRSERKRSVPGVMPALFAALGGPRDFLGVRRCGRVFAQTSGVCRRRIR